MSSFIIYANDRNEIPEQTQTIMYDGWISCIWYTLLPRCEGTAFSEESLCDHFLLYFHCPHCLLECCIWEGQGTEAYILMLTAVKLTPE